MKRKMRFFVSSVILAICLLFVQAALAGLIIERNRTASGPKAVSERQISYFQADRVKTVSQDGSFVILDLRKGTMTMVDPARKEYSVTSLEAMLNKMEAGMKQLKDRFKALPPEQRAMVEQMMGMKRSSSGGLVLKETGKTTNIAGYTAREFVILRNNQPLAEYWVSEGLRKDILSEIDKSRMDKFEKAMKKISTQGMPFSGSEATEMMKLEGKIQKSGEVMKEVHHQAQAGPMAGSSFTVVSVRKASIPASEFQIPSGYKEKTDIVPGPGFPGGN